MVSLREVGTFLQWTLTGSNSVIVPTIQPWLQRSESLKIALQVTEQ